MIELKVEKATPHDIEKVLDYSKWVAERLCGGEREIVQPILIAHSFPKTTIEKSKEISFGLREIKLFKYIVIDENEISFKEIT